MPYVPYLTYLYTHSYNIVVAIVVAIVVVADIVLIVEAVAFGNDVTVDVLFLHFFLFSLAMLREKRKHNTL